MAGPVRAACCAGPAIRPVNAPKAPGLASRACAGWSGGERAEGARQTTPEGRQALRGVSARPVARYRHPHRAKQK